MELEKEILEIIASVKELYAMYQSWDSSNITTTSVIALVSFLLRNKVLQLLYKFRGSRSTSHLSTQMKELGKTLKTAIERRDFLYRLIESKQDKHGSVLLHDYTYNLDLYKIANSKLKNAIFLSWYTFITNKVMKIYQVANTISVYTFKKIIHSKIKNEFENRSKIISYHNELVSKLIRSNEKYNASNDLPVLVNPTEPIRADKYTIVGELESFRPIPSSTFVQGDSQVESVGTLIADGVHYTKNIRNCIANTYNTSARLHYLATTLRKQLGASEVHFKKYHFVDPIIPGDIQSESRPSGVIQEILLGSSYRDTQETFSVPDLWALSQRDYFIMYHYFHEGQALYNCSYGEVLTSSSIALLKHKETLDVDTALFNNNTALTLKIPIYVPPTQNWMCGLQPWNFNLVFEDYNSEQLIANVFKNGQLAPIIMWDAATFNKRTQLTYGSTFDQEMLHEYDRLFGTDVHLNSNLLVSPLQDLKKLVYTDLQDNNLLVLTYKEGISDYDKLAFQYDFLQVLDSISFTTRKHEALALIKNYKKGLIVTKLVPTSNEEKQSYLTQSQYGKMPGLIGYIEVRYDFQDRDNAIGLFDKSIEDILLTFKPSIRNIKESFTDPEILMW